MGSSPDTAKGKWFKDHLDCLSESQCRFTSIATTEYNCVGLVAGDYQWWEPSGRRGEYWPPKLRLPRLSRGGKPTAKMFVRALAEVHFEVCPIQTPDLEPGYEKAVIYHSGNGEFKHAALISSADIWKSKLGDLEDIEHPPVISKMGSYGFVFKYLRRKLEHAGEPLPDEYKI